MILDSPRMILPEAGERTVNRQFGSELLDSRRVCRVGVYRSGQVRDLHILFDGHDEFRNGFARAAVDDCCAKQGSILSRNHLNEAIAVVFADGAIGPAHLPTADSDVLPELSA